MNRDSLSFYSQDPFLKRSIADNFKQTLSGSSNVDVTIPHNLNRFPAVLAFYSPDEGNTIIYVDNGLTLVGAGNLALTYWSGISCNLQVTDTSLIFSIENISASTVVVTVYYIIYEESSG